MRRRETSGCESRADRPPRSLRDRQSLPRTGPSAAARTRRTASGPPATGDRARGRVRIPGASPPSRSRALLPQHAQHGVQLRPLLVDLERPEGLPHAERERVFQQQNPKKPRCQYSSASASCAAMNPIQPHGLTQTVLRAIEALGRSLQEVMPPSTKRADASRLIDGDAPLPSAGLETGATRIAALCDGFDVPEPLRLIAQRTTEVGDRSGECRLRDEAALPDGVDDFVLGDPARLDARKARRLTLRLEPPDGAAVADAVERGFDLPAAYLQVREDRQPSLPRVTP